MEVNDNQNSLVANILPNFFYALQNKESHKGLKWRPV